MSFQVTNIGTFMDFPNKLGIGEEDQVLFIEGEKDSVNVLVRLLKKQMEKIVSEGLSLQIVSMKEIITPSDLFMERVRYNLPDIPFDRQIGDYREVADAFWKNLDFDGVFPLRGAFLWLGKPITAFFPVTNSWEGLLSGLEKFGKRIAEHREITYDCRFPSINEMESASYVAEPKDKADREKEYEDFYESEKLMDEIKERVDKLRIMGIEEVVIRSLFKKETPLSRLIVTRDFQILLPDYNNMEIEMEPLQKAVYLLFLRHPDGLVFKHLINHRRELLNIYRSITNRVDMDGVEKSIDRLLDSSDNSINEKCSRIKAAFLSRFDDHLAREYYISTGYDYISRDVVKNEHYDKLRCKRIPLDRSLVTYECEL